MQICRVESERQIDWERERIKSSGKKNFLKFHIVEEVKHNRVDEKTTLILFQSGTCLKIRHILEDKNLN